MSPNAPITVLIADDHPTVLESVARAVRQDPRLDLVGTATDGREALTAIRELCPDVALLDLKMPRLDGTQILDALSLEDTGTRTILFSGQLEPDTAYRGLQAGAAGVLSKVSRPAELVDAIVAVARGETVIAPEVHEHLATEIRARASDDRPSLSEREREILERVAAGESVPTIAGALYLSQSTVKKHLNTLYRKFGVTDRAAAVAEAMRRGLLH